MKKFYAYATYENENLPVGVEHDVESRHLEIRAGDIAEASRIAVECLGKEHPIESIRDSEQPKHPWRLF